jgi:hypothetical protein
MRMSLLLFACLLLPACGSDESPEAAGPAPGEAGTVAHLQDLQAQTKTVEEIRVVGAAMFSWLTDFVSAGAAGQAKTERLVDLLQYPKTSRKALEEALVPKYLPILPERDGWGHPYEISLNLEKPFAQHVMSIRSAGRDGKFSATSYTPGTFERESLDEDIVWADGYFVRSPEGEDDKKIGL